MAKPKIKTTGKSVKIAESNSMVATVFIDTHSYVKKLRKSGFTERQAEGLAEANVSLIQSNLASKQDIKDLEYSIKELEANLNYKIELLRSETKKDNELLRNGTKKDNELLRSGTKKDIELLRSGTKKDIELLRNGTKKDIELLRQEMKKDIYKAGFLVIGTLSAVMAILFKLFGV